MIIYRPNRNSLKESMAEVMEFENETKMLEFIAEKLKDYLSLEDIVLDEKVTNDIRIGWTDTRCVCTKKFGYKSFETPQCIGMFATNYDLN